MHMKMSRINPNAEFEEIPLTDVNKPRPLGGGIASGAMNETIIDVEAYGTLVDDIRNELIAPSYYNDIKNLITWKTY